MRDLSNQGSGLGTPEPAEDVMTWQTLAPFPEPMWELEGVECDGKIYLIGGITNAWGAKSGWIPNCLVYEYDPQQDRWTAMSPIPAPVHHVCLAECGGSIYGFGGYKRPDEGPDDWEPIANAWRFDPRLNSWAAIRPLPFARGAAAAASLNGKIYVTGGSYACMRRGETKPSPVAPHTSSADVFVYDPTTDTYSNAAPLLTARNHHLLEALDGRLYALGGRVGASNAFASTNKIDLVEEYDPENDSWWPKARMLAAHGGMISGIYAGEIYVAGGDGLTMVEKYNVQSNLWSAVAQLPRPRLGGSGGCVGNRFYVITGQVRTESGSEPVGDNIAIELS